MTTAAVVLTGLVAAVPAHGAAPRPDLRVGSGTVAPAAVAAGEEVRVTYAVRNAGRAAAGRSIVSVDLVSGRASVRLRTAATPALRARAVARPTELSARVPVTTRAGSYAVRVCADTSRRVRESNERNNCRDLGTVRVGPASPPPTPPVPSLPEMEPGATTVDSFSATTPWPTDESVTVGAIRAQCGRTQPARALTPAAALAALHARLTADAPDGVRRLRASSAYDDPVALQELAATGAVEGVPGLALAALLRASELEPTIGTHLVNAAAVATSIGMPNEAIALLDAADTRTFRTPATAVPLPTVSAVVRGNALVLTGRPEQARPWFEAARASAPVLSEAEIGLATAETCAGRAGGTERAELAVRRSRVRTHTKTPTGSGPAAVDRLRRLDLDQGRSTPLRTLPVPQRPSHLVAMRETYLSATAGVTEENGRWGRAVDTATEQLDAVDQRSPVAERLRRSSLVWLGRSATTPEADALEVEIDRAEQDLAAIHDEFWRPDEDSPGTYLSVVQDSVGACAGDDDPRCQRDYVEATCRPLLDGAHRRWVSALGRLDSASADRLDLLSRLRSGVAANLAERSAHRLVMLDVGELERQLYADVVHQGSLWSAMAASHPLCVEPGPGEEEETDEAPEPESAGTCPDGLERIALKASLGPVEAKINCEKIQVEVSAAVTPLLQGFTEVSYDFRSGTTTLVVGSKLKAGQGPAEGTFKSGAYISVDNRTGSVKDVGWQVGSEVTATRGAVEVMIHKSEMDISFVSGLGGAL